MDPARMTPPWTREHSAAAIAEGWEIFDSDGSDYGRWQLDELDDPPAWADRNGGVTPPELAGDEAAWKIVANGTQPHHIAARAFLYAHNPQEYQRVMKHHTGDPSRVWDELAKNLPLPFCPFI